MKIINKVLKTPDGESYKRFISNEEQLDLKLFYVLSNVLATNTPQQKERIDPLRVYSLVNKISKANEEETELDLSAEDIVYIKDIMKEQGGYNIYISGQVIDLIENQSN